jgi:hypothetical protein
MKIVNQRGDIATSDHFRKKLGKLIISVAEGFDVDAPELKKEGMSPDSLKKHAATVTQKIGLSPKTKEGQAAAGATMIAEAIAQGLKKYESKTGQKVPKHILNALQEKFITSSEEEASKKSSSSSHDQQPGKISPAPKRGVIRNIQGKKDNPS